MPQRAALIGGFAVGLLLLVYYLLSLPPSYTPPESLPPLRIRAQQVAGAYPGHFVGIQPFLTPADYAHPQRFRQKLEAYLDSAQAAGCLASPALVVFPEYIGTWLVLIGEAAPAFRATKLEDALFWAVFRRPWRFWRAYQQAKAEGWKDPAAAAIFRLKAPLMARTYHQTFAALARTYRVLIVAGSIVLPGARVVGDSLVVEPEAPLENISLLYHPDGRPDTYIVRKAFPIAAELGFTQPGHVAQLRPYETPLGRLGVLICADSWFPESYRALGKVALLAVPSYLMGDSCWNRPWGGYSGWAPPADVQPTTLTEGQAWLTYAMGGRLPRHDSSAIGLNVFLKGHFWELGADGRSIIVAQGKSYATDADILCLRLQPYSSTSRSGE
ncbi:MAG: carbon-nitrogen hydrolase family protein [Bacteroidia bacterium]|nr:carbon-nitrogen hydrolase family protein [Bacteroidia bacterium]MDW8088190.1 nitrilase-related carbon-nitrogen hydrolase [Bacteroidia bacterium]